MKRDDFVWCAGNELTANRVVTSLPAKQYGDDVKQLRFIVDSLYQEHGLAKPLVVAPDGTGNVAGTEYTWYTTFLNESGPAVVDAISRHIYNLGPGQKLSATNMANNSATAHFHCKIL